jgi:16S rRNA (adenine1518-N6/adenine1519-N6)-dimethyltransferase
MDPASPVVIRRLIDEHQFKIKKSLGQNFLADGNIINKIVDTVELTPGEVVVEIGPGLGALTRRLAAKARRVIAVEIDRSVFPILAETLAGLDNVVLVRADALYTDFNRLVQDNAGGPAGKFKVAANLPYYITTPLIMHLLEGRFAIDKAVVMVQEEVARRLTAAPGTREYGALTVAANFYAEVKTAFKVPRTVFVPRPDVDSAVVSLKVRNAPAVPVLDEADYFALVRAAFQKRRKTLLNALSSAQSCVSREDWLNILQQAGINPARRGETLSMQEFARLADAYSRTS